MKKVVIFDLKNTLVTETGDFLPSAKEIMQKTIKLADVTVLYSMNEAWTYTVLNRLKENFQQVDILLLVARKQQSDLAPFQNNRVLVVGDSLTEEIAFGRSLGFDVLPVKDALPTEVVDAFLRSTS